MKPIPSKRTAPIAGLLAKIRTDHALSSQTLAALLGVSQATLATWEQEAAPLSDTVGARVRHLRRQLAHAGFESWKFRVARGGAPELLLDRALRIVTVSPTMLTQHAFEEGSDMRLEWTTFVGRHVNDILPSLDCNLLLTHGTGLAELHDIGFFQRRVRCVRICAELNFGTFVRHGVGEIWPVDTIDAGVVAHLILHPNRVAKTMQRPAGVVVHWSQIVPAEGTPSAPFSEP
jgi:DNA-binding XRE family transcriptional regulator